MSALVVLDPDAASAWATAHGLSGEAATMAALAENPDVIAEINEGLVEVMKGFNNAEAVKKAEELNKKEPEKTFWAEKVLELKRH